MNKKKKIPCDKEYTFEELYEEELDEFLKESKGGHI